MLKNTIIKILEIKKNEYENQEKKYKELLEKIYKSNECQNELNIELSKYYKKQIDTLKVILDIQNKIKKETVKNIIKSKEANKDYLEEIIIKSLENFNYDWRTIDGISKEIRISPEKISLKMEELSKKTGLVKGFSRLYNKNIYSTLKKYRTKNNFITKLRDIVQGEIVR